MSRQSSGRFEIIGWKVSPTQGEEPATFFVADAVLDDPTNEARAKQVAEALNGKYRSNAVREERLNNQVVYNENND